MDLGNGVGLDTLTLGPDGVRGAGFVANALLKSGFDINALRTNDILRKEDWLHFDNTVVEVARARLNGVGALLSAGLRFDLPNALGQMILQWEDMSDMTPAEIDMSGVTEGERDRLAFGLKSMPLPIIHKGFELNIRHLRASQNSGTPLDVSHAEWASRMVSETVETLLFAGATNPAVLGGVIYGLRTHPNRKTDSQTANWNVATGAQILDDVLDALAVLQAGANAMYGPYGIFVPYDAFINMGNDFKAESDKTIIQRIREIPGISFITPVVDLPAGQSIIVQLTNDVVQEVVGLQPTLVQWETMGGMKFHFKVIAIMVPRVRATQTLQSGVMHLTV
jgi:uncharacterized linocin/CFP29 family protein